MHLNALDHLPHANYSHGVLYLSLSSQTTPKHAFHALQEGLRRTFKQLPWLSGKVQPISPGNSSSLEVRYQPFHEEYQSLYQLRYNELGDDIPYEELREIGFHPTVFADESLTWAPFLPDIKNGTEVFVAQANFFPNACLLASALCHVVGDGVAMNAVLKIWGAECERLQLGLSSETLPAQTYDHHVLDRIYKDLGSGRSVTEIHPDTWRLLGLAPPSLTTLSGVSNGQSLTRQVYKPELRACLFYISSANVTSLREDCRRELSSSDVSFNDTICALIWRSLMRARIGAREAADIDIQIDEDARLDLPFDARTYFPEHIALEYFGNFTMINQIIRPISFLTSPSTSIPSVAKAIRQVANEVTKTKIMDAYRLVKTRTGEEKSLTLDNLKVEGNGLIITSLVTFATDSISFGSSAFGNGGGPDAMRPMIGAISKVFRYCAILPRKRNGGVEFVATVSDDELDLLVQNDEFNKYCMLVS